MSKKLNGEGFLSLFEELRVKDNINNLDKHRVLKEFVEDGYWSKESSWEDKNNFKLWKDKTLNQVLTDTFGWSTKTYENISLILEMKNGRELYLKLGHKNMVTLKGQLPQHQRAILNYIDQKYSNKKSFSDNFISNTVIRTLWPKRVDIDEKREEKNIIDYEKELKKKDKINDKLKNEIIILKKKHEEDIIYMKRTIAILSNNGLENNNDNILQYARSVKVPEE